MASTFLAVQFEFTHAIGPHAGRYVVAHPRAVDAAGAALRSDELTRRQRLSGQTMAAGTADVLAVTLVAAAAASATPRGRIRRRSREADVAAAPADVPLILATFIRGTEPMADAEADALLLRIAEDDDAQQAWVADGLRVLNQAIRGYRAGSRDPYVTEVAQRDARATRIGYGTTDSLPDGRFTRAAVLPPPIGAKASREERLQPSETTADVLAGRTSILEGEDLLLRAYTDLDHGRTRAAALQVRAAVHLLELEFADVEGGRSLRADFEALAARADELVAAVAVGPLGEAEVIELEALLDNLERAIELWRYTPKAV
ncbi:hypothetical protein NBH00_04140 [Paraconexibacter antarcticus]|uniref:Uncharacterized protein n=1 Tax=Paraconexibacter antarcticus TaxID=2949664 RepID=A0ABY5DWF8_9ACTN|nr:hypothetical protein [Paraconexibacter antarcticus]UTI65407.1 hypothetical protein NBH00_04140 [Paraconexibacter antarcticus]